MDNYRHPGDLVVAGIHRSLRWQPDSHLDSDSGDHLDLQPGRRSAFRLRRDDQDETSESKPSEISARGSTLANRTATTPKDASQGEWYKTGGT